MIVWVVRYGNYDPSEIDTIWCTKELASARATELNEGHDWEGWQVEQWEVGTE